MSAALPARHLGALGFDVSDPPVQTVGGSAIAHNAWAHTIANAPRVRLSVEHSMPTLLRALARQYGAKLEPGEVPGWGVMAGGWFLTWRAGLDPVHRIFQPLGSPPYGLPSGYGNFFDVPALTAGMGRLESLAAVVEWLVKARGLTP